MRSEVNFSRELETAVIGFMPRVRKGSGWKNRWPGPVAIWGRRTKAMLEIWHLDGYRRNMEALLSPF